ncbi:ABC transporter permease subunit [Desulfobacterales bacterium HSG16]|nr:ABC transporter permease subunit [Desulfobacterales bacterium HSG16]
MNESVNNVKAIMKRELTGYFGSALAYVFIVIFLLLSGFFTFYISKFFEVGQADLRGFFQWHPWIFIILIPAVAMRLWSEERRMQTIELILTFPVTVWEVIIGKFLAAWIFIGVALALTFPIVITVSYLGNPDMGTIFCAYMGSFLMAGAFLSVGIMTSALTRSQVISFVLAVAACLVFILAGYPPITEMLPGWTPGWFMSIVNEMSFLTHFISIERGILDLRDLVYYSSVIFFMLFANGIIIQNRRT